MKCKKCGKEIDVEEECYQALKTGMKISDLVKLENDANKKRLQLVKMYKEEIQILQDLKQGYDFK